MTWHGHHHSYQRTCPVVAESCVGYHSNGAAKVQRRSPAMLPEPMLDFDPAAFSAISHLVLAPYAPRGLRLSSILDRKLWDKHGIGMAALLPNGGALLSCGAERTRQRGRLEKGEGGGAAGQWGEGLRCGGAQAPVHVVLGNAGADLCWNVAPKTPAHFEVPPPPSAQPPF